MSTQATGTIEALRFEFGRNWAMFLELLDDSRIEHAEASLKAMLEVETLEGCSFLDVGSGSGLFSLAARRLGARVHSFDYDPHSVGCTAELRRRFFPGDRHWTIERGSALDEPYLDSLGTFDVVYSWGVLHHTGDMWRALDLVRHRVAPTGRLALALYNDAGGRSARWRWLKRTYLTLPAPLRPLFAALAIAPIELRLAAGALVRGTPMEYVRWWTRYSEHKRGMSRWRDIVDWVGGYPYEYARPDSIFGFYRRRGFAMRRLTCAPGPLGCNELVFEKMPSDTPSNGSTVRDMGSTS
jgi:2-polyprenyl-6-hydroxyphenyl methylase/3-demethylubiquinone-9 3-methyltransferase